MEKLFYSLQFDKRIKRHIYLLKFLDKKRTIVPVKALAKELQCTASTLKKDIAYLNMILDDDFTISEHFRSGYLLENQGLNSIESFISKYAQNTLPFKIINDVFHCRILDMSQAEKKYYVSSSVIRKAIKHMNKIVLTYGIKVSANRIDFIGDEINIRFFFFYFFHDFKNNFIYVNENDIHEMYFKYIVKEIKNVDQINMKFNHSRALSWIMVNLTRILHNKKVTIQNNVKEIFVSNTPFQKFNVFFLYTLRKVFSLEHVQEDEAYWGYITRLHCISYTPTENHSESYSIYNLDYDQSMMNRVTTLINQAIQNKLLAYESTSYFIVRSYLINLFILMKVSTNFMRVSIPLSNYILDQFPHLVNTWHHVIESNGLTKFEHPIDLAVTLTMLSYNEQLAITCKKRRVLVSFHGELGLDYFLYIMCSSLVNKDINIILTENGIIDDDYLKRHHADLIVCNYDLTLKNNTTHICRLSYIPTTSEWDVLSKKLAIPLFDDDWNL